MASYHGRPEPVWRCALIWPGSKGLRHAMMRDAGKGRLWVGVGATGQTWHGTGSLSAMVLNGSVTECFEWAMQLKADGLGMTDQVNHTPE